LWIWDRISRSLAISPFRIVLSERFKAICANSISVGGNVISAENAFLILAGLRDERTSVYCFGQVFGFDIFFSGRIDRVSSEEVRIVSLDRMTSFVLRMDLPDMKFSYAEPHEFPDLNVADEKKHAPALVIRLPLRLTLDQISGPPAVPKRDTIVIWKPISQYQ
jgi:hypothetical protein